MAVDGVKIVLTIDDSQVSLATQRVGSNLQTIQKAFQQTADSTKSIDHHFNGLAGRFRDLIVVGGLLRFALYDIRDVFGATVGKVVESSAQIEKMTVLMKGLSHETNKQAKALDAIKGRDFVFNMAKNAPFEVNALTDSFVKLKSAGLDPVDGTMQTLVDSVSRFGGSSETLKRASVAIQQMAGKGVISMEELRQQLGEAVPTAMQAMATGTGLSMGQLVKHISNGEVEAGNALKRMFTVMKFENEGAAEELNKTWIGQFEKLKTNITLFQNSVGTAGGDEGFFAGIKKDLQELNAYFDTNGAKKFSAQVGVALTDTSNAVIGTIKLVVKYSEQIKILGETLAAIWVGKTVYKGLAGLDDAIKGHVNTLNSTISAERAVQTTRLALQREQVMSENKKNNEILENQIATNNGKIAALKMAQNEELALMLAHNKRALAAQFSLERGTTTRGTPVNADRASATMTSQREFARQAAANATAFVASQVAMTEANAVSTAAITANSTKAGIALAGMGTAARGTAVAIGVMKTAFNAVGGWIGVISIALTAGIALWQTWGDKAKQAADKAADSLKAARGGYAEFADVAQMGNAIRVAEIEAVRIQKKIEETQAKIESLPFKGKGSIASKILGDDITSLEKDLKVAQKTITEHGSQISAAIAQSNAVVTNAYVGGSQRAMKVALENSEAAIRSKLDKDVQEVKSSTDSEAKKAKAITELEASSGLALARFRITNYETQNDSIRAQLDKNTDKFGKTLTENGRKQKEALLEANKELIKAELGNVVSREALKAPMTFMQGDPNATGGKGKLSTIQAFINDLKAKNAGLAEEIKTGNKNLGDLAKFQQRLKDGDFNEQVKVGKGKYKTVKPSAEGISNAEKAIAEAGKLKDQADYIKKSAGDMDSAFNALESAWVDGNAKYEAALANYEENGNADSKANKKLIATLDEARSEYVRYFDSIKLGVDETKAALEAFDKYKQRAIDSPKEAKALEMSQGWKKNLDALKVASIENASERAQAERATTMKLLEDQFQMRYKAMDKESAAAKKFAEDYSAYKAALDADLARKAETPMQKMGRDWRDVTTQMQSASTSWANKTLDAFMELATTGKTSFTGLIESMLTDMLRINMQKQMSGTLEKVFGAIEKTVGGWIDGDSKSTDKAAQVGQKAATKALDVMTTAIGNSSVKASALTDSLGQSAVEGMAQAGKSATAGEALNFVANAAIAAANALNQITANGGGSVAVSGGSSGGLFSKIGEFFSGSGDGVQPGADAGAYSIDANPYLNMPSEFANGGIMSEFGSLELRKYANGGIANSPQMAIFGEGRMNEAYVPLPDGRSIPVTMTGGGSGDGKANVTVNVINQTTQQVTANQSQPRFDGKQMILDIVLTAASQPGQFREGMKGALV